MNYYEGPTNPKSEPAARASLWHRPRPGAGDRHTPLLFWFTVLGLGCVSLLSVTWGASGMLAQKGSEKLLRVDLLFPKLKSIHGERKATAFRMSEPEPSELAHPKERKTPAVAPLVIDHPTASFVEPLRHDGPQPPRLASTEVGLQWIPQVVLPAPVETCQDPVLYIQPCTPHRGDSPMIHNWKTLTMYSLLSAAAITVVPQPALVFAQAKEPQIEVKGLEELQKSITDLVKRIDLLEKKKTPALDQDALTDVIRAELKTSLAELNRKMKNVGEDVQDIKKSVETHKTELSAIQQDHIKHKLYLENQKAQLDKLALEVTLLQKQLIAGGGSPSVDKAFMEETRSSLKLLNEAIAKATPPKERLSMSPPNGASTTTGRVMLINNYSDDLLFIINGARFRVLAHSSRSVESIPVGGVNVEVAADRWGIFNRQATTIAAGDTFTLIASPPR